MNKIDKFRSNQCRNFDSCSASLCPLDLEHLKIGIWYPDEEICRKKTVPDWIRRQRKIAKKTRDPNSYFTYPMLNHDCIIGKGMVGLEPNSDLPEEPQLKNWYKKHPP
ncbi:unnamed protein product, partial [marine sediment metagenome]